MKKEEDASEDVEPLEGRVPEYVEGGRLMTTKANSADTAAHRLLRLTETVPYNSRHYLS